MSLFEDLIEDKEFDKKILKSFKGKNTLPLKYLIGLVKSINLKKKLETVYLK